MNDTTTRESGRTWLFQAQPKSFDIDGFLATLPKEFLWLARQHGAEIRSGDNVFLWRAIGKDERAKSGIIATARVISGAVQLPEDPASIPFWVNPADAVGDHLRVRLELLRVAVANRNHRRLGSQSSDSCAQNHCNGSEGPNPQSLQLGA